MAQAVEPIASDVQQLGERVRELERRVAALEHQREETPSLKPASSELTLQPPRSPAAWRGFPSVEMPGGTVPVLGKAVLGIAGAYLLRAIAESGAIPKLPVLILAIAYACLWMVWAARMHAAHRFASVTYAVTAAAILAPLLWESTVRFQVLSPWFGAAVLAAFVVLTLGLAWNKNLQALPWIAVSASMGTSISLIVATRALVPLTAGLLAVALAAEVTACLGRRHSVRALTALAADFAVWLLIYVMTPFDAVPQAYEPARPWVIALLCCALLAIYGASIGIRSFGLRLRLSAFEITQGAAAFLLATFGILRASPGSSNLLGSLFLAVAAFCYWGALGRFAGDTYSRNRRVCATYAAALLLGGGGLLFSAALQVAFLCAAGLAAAFIYTRTRKISLGLHASVYLAAAAALSPLPAYTGNALAGTVPGAPPWGVGLITASAALGYAIGSRVAEDNTRRRLLWVVPSVLVSFAAAALAVTALASLAAGRVELHPSRLSVVRTGAMCTLALVLSFAGSRWNRVELIWVAYAASAFGTLKLLFEDLRFGNAASLVLSLLFYGLILIVIPRLTRRGRVSAG